MAQLGQEIDHARPRQLPPVDDGGEQLQPALGAAHAVARILELTLSVGVARHLRGERVPLLPQRDAPGRR
eukprot:scaffold54293_cov42-Phaeocystis_antarctica.AAC.2